MNISLPHQRGTAGGTGYAHNHILDGSVYLTTAVLCSAGASTINVYKTIAHGSWLGNESGVFIYINDTYSMD